MSEENDTKNLEDVIFRLENEINKLKKENYDLNEQKKALIQELNLIKNKNK